MRRIEKPLPYKNQVSLDVKELRHRLRMNQSEFWRRIGVTQSGGSRYETGRRISRPVALLLELAYGSAPARLLKQLRKAEK